MNLRTIIVVILSIACGGAAMWAVHLSIQQQHSTTVQAPPKMETVDVVVAKVDIPLGSRLERQRLTTMKWPKESQPRGVVLAEDIESVYEQVTRVDIYKDEPILDVKYGAGRGVSSLIAKGQRAYTIETPELRNNVAGFVQAGDNVDIHFTDLRDTRLVGGLATELLLQDVLIIGVDQVIESPGLASKARSVTLSLSPQEVQVLILAQTQGTLSLALRGDGDDTVLKAGITYWSEVQRQRMCRNKHGDIVEPADRENQSDSIEKPRFEMGHTFVLRGPNSSVMSLPVPRED